MSPPPTRVVGAQHTVGMNEELWMALFKKGQPRPPGAGLQKGQQTKVTKARIALKEALLNSFDTLGGERYLVELGRKQPKVYATLLAKCIPVEVRGPGDNGEHYIMTEISSAKQSLTQKLAAIIAAEEAE